MTPNLTLSYGLRWDYQPPFREADDQISTFLPDIANPGAAGRPGALAFASTDVDRYGHSFQDNWYSGYGPRLGIGYMVTPKTNLRASWGLYYNGTGNQNSVTPVGYQASPSFQSPNNYHAGVQLERPDVPADVQPSAARSSRRSPTARPSPTRRRTRRASRACRASRSAWRAN